MDNAIRLNPNAGIFLAALGCLTSASLENTQHPEISDTYEVFDFDENGEFLPVQYKPPSSRFQRILNAMIANDYALIKTVLKLQSILEDIDCLDAAEQLPPDSSKSPKNVLTDILPYLSTGKREFAFSLSHDLMKLKEQLNTAGDFFRIRLRKTRFLPSPLFFK